MQAGEWGTVCDDRFSLVDADVACRQLGWGTAAALVPRSAATYGHGGRSHSSLRVWMDGLQCTGQESRLDACAFGGWGVENCVHEEDVALQCNASDSDGGTAMWESHATAATAWAASAAAANEAALGSDACTLSRTSGAAASSSHPEGCGPCLVVLAVVALAGGALLASSAWALKAAQVSARDQPRPSILRLALQIQV